MIGPTVSVIIPTYNGGGYIGETLDALARQSVPIHEVVVVDDGSTDGSAALAQSHPIGPLVIHQAHCGVAFARNLGVSAATGQFIALLDQDDLWAPDRHARLLRFLNAREDVQALVTTCTGFHLAGDRDALLAAGDRLHQHTAALADGQDPRHLVPADDGTVPPVIRSLSRRELLAGPPSVTASYVVERRLYQAAGGCVPFARSFDDWLMLLHLTLATDVVLIDEPSLLYRVHSASTTMSTDWHLPLLTAVAAMRHGGNLTPRGHGRDPRLVAPVDDERHFVWHQLLGLAQQPGGLRDALAVTALLGRSPSERWALAARVLRRSLSHRRRRRL